MALVTDRRSVLAGLTLLGLGGCEREKQSAAATAPLPPRDVAFDLSDLERENGGRIGLSILDGHRASWRADERFNYCSTFKLFLSAAMLEKIQHGDDKADRAVPVTAADMVPHAPVTEKAVGQTLTLTELMAAAVEVSDNAAANILIRELGGLPALEAWYRRAGDDTTRVDRMEPMLNVKDGDKDTTQPFRAASNLNWILEAYQPLVFQSRYRPLWDWLIDSPTGEKRIKAGVPDGWTVAHKTGTGGTGQTNDIGVVYPPMGDPIPVAVFYEAPESLAPEKRDEVIATAVRRGLAALGHGLPAEEAGA
ncbi:MAG: class A beta-lactamase [Caulobacteraceae bacterium]|nr:class A beta-lactamase [Caulobacteraceae bacterium]